MHSRFRAWFVFAPLIGACSDADTAGTTPDVAALEALLVKYSVCELQPLAEGIEQLATVDGTVPAPLTRCAAAATDCHEFLECLGMDPARERCDPQDARTTCAGDRLRVCRRLRTGDFVWFVEDCAGLAPGSTCVATEGVEATCGVALCDPGDVPGCVGELATYCDPSGVQQRRDCARAGHHCLLGGDAVPVPFCAPHRENRCVDRPGFCDGHLRFDCLQRGERSDLYAGALNCRLLDPGFTCLEIEHPIPGSPNQTVTEPVCGDPARPPAEPQRPSGRCEGARAHLCFGEACRTYDCAAFMNATCQTSQDGVVGCVSPDWQRPDEEG